MPEPRNEHARQYDRETQLIRIEVDDDEATKVGRNLIRILKLRPDRDHKGRWKTTWGNKTAIGMARTVLRIILDEE